MEELNLNNFKAINAGLFNTSKGPTLTVKNNGITFNSVCLSEMEDVVYIRIFIDEVSKILAVVECTEETQGALRWCNIRNEKRRPRKLSGEFSDMLYELMGWDISYRYVIEAKKTIIGDKQAFFFYLKDAKTTEDYKIRRLINLMDRINRQNRKDEIDGEAAQKDCRNENPKPSIMSCFLEDSLLNFLKKSQNVFQGINEVVLPV